MAKERIINTRFWNDGFVSHLDPIEKLLFIYFLTNEHTNISGIYELPLKIAAVETGIDPSMMEKIMPRLSPKVSYESGYVIIPNFVKHQHFDSGNVQVGIKRELSLIPSHILDKAEGYGYPLQGGPYTKPNLTKPIGSVSDETLTPSFEEYLEERGVTSDYEGDGEVSDLVYRENGKAISVKKLMAEFEKAHPTPSERPKKAPKTRDHFDFDTWLEELRTSTLKANNIIALIWKEKGYRFENYEQWKAQMGMDQVYAKKLVGYTGKQIAAAIQKCEEDSVKGGYDWKASTVLKKIAETMK